MASVGQVKCVFYYGETDDQPKPQSMAWDDLASVLLQHEFTACGASCPGGACLQKKGGLAWSPTIMSGPRKDRFVQGMTLLVFDVDHTTEQALVELDERLQGIEALMHSTHSHRPPADCCARLVLPLSRVVTPQEWVSFRVSVADYFGIQDVDPKTKNLSRLYYMPSAPEGAEVISGRRHGSVLDVDAFLKTVRIQEAKQLGMQVVAAPVLEPGVVDMGALRKAMANYRPAADDAEGESKKRWLRNLLDGNRLAEVGERDDAINKTAGVLAGLFPKGTQFDEMIYEVMRASVALMDPPETGTWEDKLIYSCRRAHSWRSERDANDAAFAAAFNEKFFSGVSHQQSPAPQPQQTAAQPQAAPEEAPEAEEDPDDWQATLDTNVDKKGVRTLKPTGHNVFTVLRSCPGWKGVLRFNEITKDVECAHATPLGDANALNPSVFATNVNNWFNHHQAYKLELSTSIIQAQVLAVARRNPYDPLKEYLERAVKWDGTVRADSFLERYFNVTVGDRSLGNIAEYVRQVSVKWLISAVARALSPGCKVDTVLVFQGGQGARKSSAFEILGGEWFAGSQLNLADKDSKLLAAQNWIIELGELASLQKAEIEQYKMFLSSREDKFRPPYAATIETHKRRSVFVGSTNKSHYLVDLTGNRRFWPVTCGDVDLEALARDRDQIWAEAVARFNAGNRRGDNGHHWWFAPGEQHLVNQQTQDRMRVPPRTDSILTWWLRQAPDKRPSVLRANDIAADVLLIPTSQINEAVIDSVDRALQFLGFRYEKQGDESLQPWAWVPSDELAGADTENRRGFLKLVKPEGA